MSERLDQIEAAMAAMQQRMDRFHERMEQYFENQMRPNADLRTRQEVQAQNLEVQRQSLEALAQNIEILRESISVQRDSLLLLSERDRSLTAKH